MYFTFEEFWSSYLDEQKADKCGLSCTIPDIKNHCEKAWEEAEKKEKIKADIVISFLKKEVMHKASYKAVMKRQYRELKQDLKNQQKSTADVAISWSKKYGNLLTINTLLKEILVMALDHNDLCHICEELGQSLPECQCKCNPDCVEHMVNLLASSKKKRRRIIKQVAREKNRKMALTDNDYETIDVNKDYKVVRKCVSTGEVETVVEDGSALMEEDNGGYGVLD